MSIDILKTGKWGTKNPLKNDIDKKNYLKYNLNVETNEKIGGIKMWFNYTEFARSFGNNIESEQEIPEGAYEKLQILYNIMVELKENKSENTILTTKKNNLENETNTLINDRKKEIQEHLKLNNKKNEYFNNVLLNNDNNEQKIMEINEKIIKLEESINSKENEIVEKKKNLIEIRTSLEENNSKNKELNKDLKQSKRELNVKSMKINKSYYTDFENAEIEDADKMIKKSIIEVGGVKINENLDLNKVNYTRIIAKSFKEQAKYEREAAKYAQKILKDITNGKIHFKEFCSKMKKMEEAYQFINGVGTNTFDNIVQQEVVSKDKSAQKIYGKTITKDYEIIGKLIDVANARYDDRITSEEYDKAYNKANFERENIINDEKKSNNFVNKIILNNVQRDAYTQRRKTIDGIYLNLPYNKMPVVIKENKNDNKKTLKSSDLKENKKNLKKEKKK